MCFLSLLCAAAAAKSLQSCLTLCDPRDGSPPGSSVPGILQARTLEWVAISFSKVKVKSESEVAQSCPTPSDPMDCSLLGSSVHGIFQARVLEWVAIAFSDKNIYFCFIHYTKVFDCVDHNEPENSSRVRKTRPSYLSPEKSVCWSRSNS